MYDPTVGRWLTEDPIGFAGEDMNLYRYVGNGPTKATDPSGLRSSSRGDGSGPPVGPTLEKKIVPGSGYYFVVAVDVPETQHDTGQRWSGHVCTGLVDASAPVPSMPKINIYGLTPDGGPSRINPQVPGKVEVQDEYGVNVIRAYPISRREYLNLLRSFNTDINSPPPYHIADQNCSSWAASKGKKIGLFSNLPQTPITVINDQDLNKPDYTPAGFTQFLINDPTRKPRSIIIDLR